MSARDTQRRWAAHRKGYGTWHDAKRCSRCGTYHGSPDGCPANRYLDRQYLVEVYIPEGFPLLTGPNEEAGWYPLWDYGRESDARMRAREAAKYEYPEARVVDQWEDGTRSRRCTGRGEGAFFFTWNVYPLALDRDASAYRLVVRRDANPTRRGRCSTRKPSESWAIGSAPCAVCTWVTCTATWTASTPTSRDRQRTGRPRPLP